MENIENIDEKVEEIYRQKKYSCAGYMCVVATTCYSEEEKKKICCQCLKNRILYGN